MKKIIIYTDGGSRGNPGKAAIGVVFLDENGSVIKKFGEYLGDGLTNNEAEYTAVHRAFKELLLMPEIKPGETELEIRSDSQLLVNQLSGKFKINQEHIRAFVVAIQRLMTQFTVVRFVAIPRERNKEADKLVNQALDAQMTG